MNSTIIVLRRWRLRYFLFIFTTLLGSLGAISSVDWMGVWLGIEVNLFRVLPMLLGGGSSREAECCVKYFVVQVVGSVVVVGGGLFSMGYWGCFTVGGSFMGEVALVIVVVGLMIKLGFVPFHFWLPGVLVGVS